MKLGPSFYNHADVISDSFHGLVAEAEQLSLVGHHGVRLVSSSCASGILTAYIYKLLELENVLLRLLAGAVAKCKAHY